MAESKWVGKIVKFKSGKIGMVIDSEVIQNTVFLVVLISGQGIINIRAKDVEVV